MSYLKTWHCDRCDEYQQTIDRPKLLICDKCSGSEGFASNMATYTRTTTKTLLRQAYERGYKHGKESVSA